MASNSAAAIAVNVLTSPGEAFRTIKEKPSFVLPLVLLLVIPAIAQYIYVSGVDIQWLTAQQLAAATDLTEAQIEQQSQAAAEAPRGVIAGFGALAAMLFVGILMLLQGLYFRIASAVTKSGLLYKQTFSLVCWAGLPSVLTSVASIANLLASDISLMPATEINPLAIWALLNLEPLGTGTLDQIVMNLDPLALWGLALTIIGYKIMSGKDYLTAAIIGLLPTALIVGLAFAF